MSANLKIISDLKNFITESSVHADLKPLFTTSLTDFSRERKLGFERLVLLLVNFFRKSYSLELTEFYDCIDEGKTRVSKSGFCQQRMKIKSFFFDCLNAVLVQSFYQHYGQQIKRWRGLRLIAVDGSTAYLVNNDAVIKHFGTQGNQCKEVPMGQIVSAFDVLNEITIRADMYPIKVSEQSVAHQWISRYDSDMLLIYDRGHPGFTSIFLHQSKEEPQPFLMRCSVGFNNPVKLFVHSTDNDCITSFKANKYASDELYQQGFMVPVGSAIEIRLIKVVLENGTIEVLITNLFDIQQYPHASFKELYFKRWGIETKYDTVKNQLQLEAFSGQKVATIMQDFYITFFLSNLQEIIAKPCEQKVDVITRNRKYHYKINRNIAFGLMKNRIIVLFMIHDPDIILHLLEDLFVQHIEPIRPNRKYPHLRKAIRAKGKYQALTNYKRAM